MVSGKDEVTAGRLRIGMVGGGPGAFIARYDSTDEDGAYKTAGSVTLKGTNAWIPWTAVLANPRFFNRQSAGGDLQIVASGVEELRIRRLAVRRRPAESLPRLHLERANVDPAARSRVLRIEARGVYVFEGAGGVSAARLAPTARSTTRATAAPSTAWPTRPRRRRTSSSRRPPSP